MQIKEHTYTYATRSYLLLLTHLVWRKIGLINSCIVLEYIPGEVIDDQEGCINDQKLLRSEG